MIDRAVGNLRAHVGTAPALYELTCAAAEWNAVRKRINLADGEYIRIRTDCTDDAATAAYWVVTSAPVKSLAGAAPKPISPGEAIAHATALLNAYAGHVRSVSSSRGWAEKKKKEKPKFRRVGKAAANVAQVIDAVAAAHGCIAERITSATDPTRRRTLAKWRFRTLTGEPLDADDRRAMQADLMQNVDGDSYFGVEFSFGRQPKTQDTEPANAATG